MSANIDYQRMAVSGPKLKSALTRSQKRGYDAVKAACTLAVREWEQVGAWPDNWSNWQRALDDAACIERRPMVRLEDL